MGQSFAEWMSSIGNLLKSLERVAQVAIVVGQVVGRANDSDVKTIHVHGLADAGIENGVFCLRVRADEEKQVCLVNPNDS